MSDERTYEDKHKEAIAWLTTESTKLIDARLAKHLLDYIFKCDATNAKLEAENKRLRNALEDLDDTMMSGEQGRIIDAALQEQSDG